METLKRLSDTKYTKKIEVEKDISDLLRCKKNALIKIQRERQVIAQIDRELQELVDVVDMEVEGYTKTSVVAMENLPLSELEEGREIASEGVQK